ncbi:hypothetical protein GDO81_026368 [Engystomops pustulosus]|uniref:RWD domain-containing protein n=1 Tax=Engystomops pustulosus TaxID=76066 RepID=A0AAV6YFW1_ENGPU|nr:hypothetical protein GDO81_026368 [Engystomops pustulosus]
MTTEDQVAQEEELLALASIYYEDEFRRTNGPPGGEFKMCLELPSDFLISIKSE